MYFLQFCHRTPALAAKYMEHIKKQGSHGRERASAIFKSSGQLAIAAPEALAELAWRVLVPAPVKRDRVFPPERREPFTYADRDLLNVSPARGLNLLEHAPHVGLGLVRRLVGHLVEFQRQAGQAEGEPITIALPLVTVGFKYPWTYAWSRDANGNYSVTCALMALEAWAHRRIEAGQSIDGVVADIMGGGDCAAAFLLIVVDILISHWPKTRQFAIPFLGVPDLLALDQQRQNIDTMRSGAFDFGLFGEKEPQGLATLESLRRRASRVAPLGNLLMYYALSEPLAERDEILRALRAASERLGPPRADADLVDPAFMAEHSINMLDPANYRPVKVPQKDGSQIEGIAYFAPPAEYDHLASGLAGAQARMQEIMLRNQLAETLDDPGKSTAALIDQGVDMARRAQEGGIEQPDFDRSLELRPHSFCAMGTPNSANPMLAGHENSVQPQLADRRIRCTVSAQASDSIRWESARWDWSMPDCTASRDSPCSGSWNSPRAEIPP
jgi:hypothetical protein